MVKVDFLLFEGCEGKPGPLSWFDHLRAGLISEAFGKDPPGLLNRLPPFDRAVRLVDWSCFAFGGGQVTYSFGRTPLSDVGFLSTMLLLFISGTVYRGMWTQITYHNLRSYSRGVGGSASLHQRSERGP